MFYGPWFLNQLPFFRISRLRFSVFLLGLEAGSGLGHHRARDGGRSEGALSLHCARRAEFHVKTFFSSRV